MFVTHTTLLEISCCGSYTDLLAALERRFPHATTLEPKAGFIKTYSQTNFYSQYQEVVSHYILKESVNLQIHVFMCIYFT